MAMTRSYLAAEQAPLVSRYLWHVKISPRRWTCVGTHQVLTEAGQTGISARAMIRHWDNRHARALGTYPVYAALRSQDIDAGIVSENIACGPARRLAPQRFYPASVAAALARRGG
jgi:hypothetical protein